MIGFLLTGFDCGGADVLRVIKFVMSLLDIVLTIVPIALILMIAFDFFKNIIGSKEDEIKKNISIVTKRIIGCICLFLLPTVIKFTIQLLGNLGIDYASCITIALEKDLSEYEIKYPENNYEIPKTNLGGSSVTTEPSQEQGDTNNSDDDDVVSDE